METPEVATEARRLIAAADLEITVEVSGENVVLVAGEFSATMPSDAEPKMARAAIMILGEKSGQFPSFAQKMREMKFELAA